MTTKRTPDSDGGDAAVTLEQLDESIIATFGSGPPPLTVLAELDEALDSVFGPITQGS